MKTLQEKQEEKGRLTQQYLRNKRAAWKAFCERQPRILEFQKEIRQLDKPADILALLRGSWIMDACMDTRVYALRIIDAHANRMVLKAGGSMLDDPLPPKRNLYLVARELLRIR